MKRAGILCAVAIACLLPGCRKSTTYTGRDGTKATVTKTGEGTDVTIQGKDGTQVRISEGGNLALPESFPKDVPTYPGAKVTANVTVNDGVQVSFQTPDSATKVVDFYAEKLKAGGFTMETTMNTEASSMVTAKKDKRTVMVMAGRESDGTRITLMVHSEKKSAGD